MVGCRQSPSPTREIPMGRTKGSRNAPSGRSLLFQYAEMAKGGGISHREKLVELTNTAFFDREFLLTKFTDQTETRGVLIAANRNAVHIRSNCAGKTPEEWQRMMMPVHVWGHLMCLLHSGLGVDGTDAWLDKDGPDMALIKRFPVVRERGRYSNFARHPTERLVLPDCPQGIDEVYVFGGRAHDLSGEVYITADIIDEMHSRIREWASQIIF